MPEVDKRLAFSSLEQQRREDPIDIPEILRGSAVDAQTLSGTPVAAEGGKVEEAIRSLFPKTVGASAVSFAEGGAAADTSVSLRIGCVLSGGQASGGHNVIVGVSDWLKR